MKYLLLLITIIGRLQGFGQSPTTQLNDWDSLRMRTKTELDRYERILQKELCYSDTLKSKGLTVITHYSTDKRTLQKVSNYLDAHNCIVGIYQEYFNSAGLLEFARALAKCCSKAETGDEICLERVTDYQRVEYDNKGRVRLRVSHVTTPMTYKEVFTYTPDGTKHVKREKIREPKFWD